MTQIANHVIDMRDKAERAGKKKRSGGLALMPTVRRAIPRGSSKVAAKRERIEFSAIASDHSSTGDCRCHGFKFLFQVAMLLR